MSNKILYKIISHFYDLLDVVYFRNYQNSPRKAVLDSVGDRDKILDLCTGTATNAIRIARAKPCTQIIGIDLSKDMLRIAQDKLRKQHIENVELRYMDATEMCFEDESFNKVLISLVLHELDEALAEKLLKEAKRILKDTGEIIVTEWEPSKALWRKILFFPVSLLEPKPYKAFIKKDLYKYFREFGLEIVEETHCDYSKVLKITKMKTTEKE